MAAYLSYAAIALLLLVLYLSLDIMGILSRRNKFDVDGRTVLLTGGSYGMGRSLAALLSSRGASLILVARDPAKLASAVEHAKSHAKHPSTQRFTYISADVSSEAENERLLKEATAWNNGKTPEVVWAHAGSASPMLFVESSIETQRRQMDLNYWAACYLAHKTLRAWLYPETPYPAQTKTDGEKKAQPEPPRYFIVTSSVIAFVNIAGYAPYGPAKTALRALCDALNMEILLYNGARRSNKDTGTSPAPFDIHVRAIFPGTIKSPGLEQENKTKHAVTHLLEESDPAQTEMEAAVAAIKGLERGDFMTATNWLGEVLRISSLGGSKRNGVVRDTLGQWLTSLVWLVAGPDMEGKVWGWGKKEGMPEFRPEGSR
ncbi:NAD(P)-binding protein [Westerdykella ornata]|uniref:3-dehydrosphinganine reductase n=1 Tax=Westerdykella ornata TaxID=318751 RepID=A0A6A6JHS7_WESOR|nr:NAD(P)-binding protein [Westerdykella ornata]KAF2276111.1 NAD(P)-binding protein [Westerdykella ornata]